MPPVASNSAGSVTERIKSRPSAEPEATRRISIAYSLTSSPRTLARTTAGPGSAVPVGTASASVGAASSRPKMPLLVLAYSGPRSRVRSKSPRSSPAAPASPRFTAFTVEGRMEPLEKGISSAVSVSVTPWPRAPKTPVAGSYQVMVPIPAMLSRTQAPMQ